MLIEPTRIPEVLRITPRRLSDARGHFVEVFNHGNLLAAGVDFRPVQENQSLSRTPGTVRGLHFQRPPFAQAKLVRVLRGRIFDVAVDIRMGSPTYRHWIGAELSSSGGEQLYIPVGFAHGFCTLEPDSELAYLVDAPYSPACDGTVRWDDVDIAIDWPETAGAVISEKDSSAPRLADLTPPF
jgi:dTDP-4-dehydrorhamnose 3,5-epimerase